MRIFESGTVHPVHFLCYFHDKNVGADVFVPRKNRTVHALASRSLARSCRFLLNRFVMAVS